MASATSSRLSSHFLLRPRRANIHTSPRCAHVLPSPRRAHVLPSPRLLPAHGSTTAVSSTLASVAPPSCGCRCCTRASPHPQVPAHRATGFVSAVQSPCCCCLASNPWRPVPARRLAAPPSCGLPQQCARHSRTAAWALLCRPVVFERRRRCHHTRAVASAWRRARSPSHTLAPAALDPRVRSLQRVFDGACSPHIPLCPGPAIPARLGWLANGQPVCRHFPVVVQARQLLPRQLSSKSSACVLDICTCTCTFI